MNITLMRHGATKENLTKAYIGELDSPLCEEGIQQMKSVHFPQLPTKIYVTNKLRTQESAFLLNPKAEQVIVSGLQEMNFGVFEGKNYKDLSDDSNYKNWVDSQCKLPCPQGESLETFIFRCKNAFINVVHHENDSIFFLIHGGSIMSICSSFVPNTTYFQWQIPCGSYLNFHWNGKFLEELK